MLFRSSPENPLIEFESHLEGYHGLRKPEMIAQENRKVLTHPFLGSKNYEFPPERVENFLTLPWGTKPEFSWRKVKHSHTANLDHAVGTWKIILKIIPLKTKKEIVENWLPRYTGTPLNQFGKFILLTNFGHYVELFAKWNKVKVNGKDKPMPNATAGDISIINFGMGSANAATMMDLLTTIQPRANGISDERTNLWTCQASWLD